jgi:3-hydroxyacyl-[acyl-carrier-protein] dehydratase
MFLTLASRKFSAPTLVSPEVFEMRFCLLDRIESLQTGHNITAVRTLTGQEDYLADHFPLFPVMPGVLMLEAMYQASAWLLRVTDDFQYSVVTLKEARSIKYSDFVVPGKTLRVSAELQKRDGRLTTFKTQGIVNGSVAVSGRLLLESYNLAERYPARSASDTRARAKFRNYFERLQGPQALLFPKESVST